MDSLPHTKTVRGARGQAIPEACENTSTVVRGDATRPLLPAESETGIGTAIGLNSGSSRAVS